MFKRQAVLGVTDLAQRPIHGHALPRGPLVAVHLQADAEHVTVLHAQPRLEDLLLGSRCSQPGLAGSLVGALVWGGAVLAQLGVIGWCWVP